MLRAAARLQAMGAELVDLRVPVAWAVAEVYGGRRSDEELVAMIAVLTPLTALSERFRWW